MIPIHSVVWHEWTERGSAQRVPEPEAMEDPKQIADYVKAYEWGGPTSALQLHHLKEVTRLLRPGDTVVDLACGPGPLLLELAALYPQCRFIGVDLSQPMLDALMCQASERGLGNIGVLCEDARLTPQFADGSVDLVITTSALHHLPDLDSLNGVFLNTARLLGLNGAYYMFDFALLRSERTRELLVREVGKTAPALTTHDYAMSLRAAFPLDVVIDAACKALPKPIEVRASLFVDFFYFLQSPPRTEVLPETSAALRAIWAKLPTAARLEHTMLRTMRRRFRT